MIPLRYRDDPGLEFLQFCSHEDLEPLVEILTKDKGKNRWAGSLEKNKEFARNRYDFPIVWRLIALPDEAPERFGKLAVQCLHTQHDVEILGDAEAPF